MAQLFTNNAKTRLLTSLTDVATSLTIQPGTQALFPVLVSIDDWFVCTIEDSGLNEIVKVIATSSNTFTVERGHEGTTARAWAAGATLEIRLTAGGIGQIQSDILGGISDTLSLSNTGAGVGVFRSKVDDDITFKSLVAGANVVLTPDTNQITVAVPSLTGNASTATTLQTARTIAISGAVVGTATSFNGSANISIPVTSVDVSSPSITGTLPVNRGGTGIASYTTGNYINASGATSLQQRTPVQVLSDIGAAASSHNHDAEYVNVTGDTMTGDLTISKASPRITLTAPSGSAYAVTSSIDGQVAGSLLATAGSTRWTVEKTASAESGGNVGSDLSINRFADNGAFLDTVFQITRSTGASAFGGNVTISKASPTLTLSSTSGQASIFVNAATNTVGGMFLRSGSSVRWGISKTSLAESGSNAGSDFVIERYSDAGAYLSNALSITRSNGYIAIPGVYNQTTGSAGNVFVDSSGNLMRSTSSMQYKTDVETVQDEYADKILSLTPIWYRSLCTSDRPDWSYYGLSAEEVASVIPQLAQYETTKEVRYSDVDENGDEVVRVEYEPLDTPKPNGVMYDRFTPLLINLVKRQESRIAALELKVEQLLSLLAAE